ncbi:MAG: hypothetical protein ACRCYG_16315 [Aeromonas veronii]
MAKKKKYVPRPAVKKTEFATSDRSASQHLVETLNQQLQTLRSQLIEQEARFAQEKASLLSHGNKPLDEVLELRFRELAMLTRYLEEKDTELDVIRQKLHVSQQRHSLIKKTVSWKVTRPLRWAAQKLNLLERNQPLTAQEKQIRDSGFFDAKWYREQYLKGFGRHRNPLRHYLETGYRQGCNPSPRFDTRWYLEQYPDVKAADINPLLHYLLHGQHEQRRPHQ